VLLNKASGTTIEVGCGKGRFLDRLKASGHVQSIWGVDIDPVAVKNAYRKGFNAIRADGQKLPFKKEVFDTVVSARGSLVEIGWKPLLSEVYKIIKPGGCFAFDTFNRYSLDKKIKYKLMRLLNIPHYPYIGKIGGIETMKEFETICSTIGFKIISLYTIFPLPLFPYGVLIRGRMARYQFSTRFICILKK